MPTPLIGVTTSNIIHPKYKIPIVTTPKSYLLALVGVGALPTLIPPNLPLDSLEEYLSHLDGIVFTGGGDIETARFGGVDHEAVHDEDPERDEIEIQLVLKASEKGLPFLGICRGLQVVNVAYGGTLYTHISDQLENTVHQPSPSDARFDEYVHSVKIEKESFLGDIVGETEFQVNSLHHLGVKEMGQGLKAVAWAPDGLVEGLELPGHPFGVTVQWHPEWLMESKPSQALFKAFVETASKSK
jgi:putative glutamine amidotransferase